MPTLIVSGANGKMGKEIVNLSSFYGYDNVLKVDEFYINTNCSNDIKYCIFCDKFKEFESFSILEKTNIKADCIIDFSSNEGTELAVNYAIKSSTPIIIGTTNLSKNTVDLIKKASEKIPVCLSTNYSIFINSLLKNLTKIYNDCSPEKSVIIETHHENKKDIPSGTSISLNEKLDSNAEIYSIRASNVFGIHDIIFYGKDEILEIKHTANSKKIFAEGALKISKLLKNKQPNLYSSTDF